MTNKFQNFDNENNLASGFTNFDGDNLDNYLGHEMIEIKENYVKSKIKVKDYHKQPMGLVHGGLFSTLAETICSYGANYLGQGTFVGVNNNTDFLLSVKGGEIYCIAEPIEIGRSFQLWECKMYHDEKLCAVSKVRLSKIR